MSVAVDAGPKANAIADAGFAEYERQARAANLAALRAEGVSCIAESARMTPPAGRHATAVRASHVKIERPRWLDKLFIPAGVLTVISGRAGVSKSTFAIARAAQATRGRLEGDYARRPVNVAFSAIEDSDSMQAARLQAAGADLNRVLFIGIAEGTADAGMSLPKDLPIIRQLLLENDVKLWILDPITSVIDGNTNSRDDVRRVLDPLAALANELGIAIVGIAHFNKGGGYGGDKISGSHAFRDAVRSMLLIAKDDEQGDCVLTIDKSNYSTVAGQSFSYSLGSAEVTDANGDIMKVPIITGFMPSKRNVSEVINGNIARAEHVETDGHGVDDADRWLLDYLEEYGPTSFSRIAEDARGCAPSYTKDQLRAARKRLGNRIMIAPDNTHSGRGRSYKWSLSQSEPDQ